MLEIRNTIAKCRLPFMGSQDRAEDRLSELDSWKLSKLKSKEKKVRGGGTQTQNRIF